MERIAQHYVYESSYVVCHIKTSESGISAQVFSINTNQKEGSILEQCFTYPVNEDINFLVLVLFFLFMLFLDCLASGNCLTLKFRTISCLSYPLDQSSNITFPLPPSQSFVDLQFPNGQLTYVSGEGLTTTAFLPFCGGLLQAQGQYPGEMRFSFCCKVSYVLISFL